MAWDYHTGAAEEAGTCSRCGAPYLPGEVIRERQIDGQAFMRAVERGNPAPWHQVDCAKCNEALA